MSLKLELFITTLVRIYKYKILLRFSINNCIPFGSFHLVNILKVIITDGQLSTTSLLCIHLLYFIILYICILSHIAISLSLFLSVFCAACQCFKTLVSVLNTCHFKIFKIIKTTTCFGLNWPSSGVNTCF
jgi:hypothetical protein